jgi:hypothetical protein
MTNDSLDLLVDFRSEVSPPDEATTRRIYRLATAAPLHRWARRLPRRPLWQPQLTGRRRRMALSAAATVTLSLAGVLVGLTLSAAAPASAYAAAKHAIAATSAGSLDSGTVTRTFVLGNHTTLETTQWNGNDISIASDHGSLDLAGDNQLLLVGGSVYVQSADGTWQRYASESDIGVLERVLQRARTNVSGSSAAQILALVPNLQKTVQPDGTTVYTGTIPASDSAEVTPSDNTAARLGARLQSVGRVSQFKLVVGSDGLVRQLSETADDGSMSSSTQYSQLGSTPPITTPGS